MDHYYNHETRSFFNTATYTREQIPERAVKVSSELKERLLEGERTGLVITIDAEGLPILVVPEKDLNEPLRIERAWRDGELARVSWLRERHSDELALVLATTITAEEFNELLTYMQALRDWPSSPEFPGIDARPVPPAVVSSL